MIYAEETVWHPFRKVQSMVRLAKKPKLEVHANELVLPPRKMRRLPRPTPEWDAFRRMPPGSLQIEPAEIKPDVAGFGSPWVQFTGRHGVQWHASEYHFTHPTISWWKVKPQPLVPSVLGFVRNGRQGPSFYWYHWHDPYCLMYAANDFAPHGPLQRDRIQRNARVDPLLGESTKVVPTPAQVDKVILESAVGDLWQLMSTGRTTYSRRGGPIYIQRHLELARSIPYGQAPKASFKSSLPKKIATVNVQDDDGRMHRRFVACDDVGQIDEVLALYNFLLGVGIV